VGLCLVSRDPGRGGAGGDATSTGATARESGGDMHPRVAPLRERKRIFFAFLF